MKHVVVDGRVFATEAADRGMGRYVDHIVALLADTGHTITVLLPPSAEHASPRSGATRRLPEKGDPLAQTVVLNRLLESVEADAYVDATPFLAPMRYDISVCPVVAVLYDLIPMRFPGDYFAPSDEGSLDAYVNGLARVRKADRVIAISNTVKRQALRYLGIAAARVDVVPPAIGAEYTTNTDGRLDRTSTGGRAQRSIVCIQGAHRSKNFPAAVRFLEDLSSATGAVVDVIVPTPTQRSLVDGVRRSGTGDLRVCDSISEVHKVALQKNALVVAHLSLEEGYGIPLVEALLLGRPVICVDNAINRELIGGGAPSRAGILLLRDPSLRSDEDLAAAIRFVESADAIECGEERAKIFAALSALHAGDAAILASAIAQAAVAFSEWHSRAGMAIVAPTELGTCGVSDYCYALMRDGAPRYVVLLGRAPRAMLLLPNVRLVPVEAIDLVRRRATGFLFNLAVSKSLLKAFDEIALRSGPADVLVVHDAGSYLPGLLLDAAERASSGSALERYLKGESAEVRTRSELWLREPPARWSDSEAIFHAIDRQYKSAWLRSFRGTLVSHHPAFAASASSAASAVLGSLPTDSVIRNRTCHVAMPIDDRLTAGGARLADTFRWTLRLGRGDLLICCAGSIVRGKYLDVVARTVARLNQDWAGEGRAFSATLLLAGRVLEPAVYESVRGEFEAHGAGNRVVQVQETEESHYDALLLASDAVVAFRQQLRIQMSHAYVRALALGRPMITNEGAGFDDVDAALVCRDAALEDDLHKWLDEMARSPELRARLAAQSLDRYRRHHRVDQFFARVRALNAAAGAV